MHLKVPDRTILLESLGKIPEKEIDASINGEGCNWKWSCCSYVEKNILKPDWIHQETVILPTFNDHEDFEDITNLMCNS